jgi:hypothetical protein
MITYLISEAPELCTMKNKHEETPLCMACREVLHNGAIFLLVNTNSDMLHVSNQRELTPLHHGE